MTDDDRQPWLAAIAHWIDERLASNECGIVSCSALKRAYRRVIVGDREGVRLVYLKGDMALIGDRISRRKNHFMPPALLKSQFDALEEPQADERALSVQIALPPRRVVEAIVQQLGLAQPAQG